MIKKASCFAALLLMAACSSGSVSEDSASKDKLSADRSEVEAYEQNDTTLSVSYTHLTLPTTVRV